MTGGYIRNAALRAAFLAAGEGNADRDAPPLKRGELRVRLDGQGHDHAMTSGLG